MLPDQYPAGQVACTGKVTKFVVHWGMGREGGGWRGGGGNFEGEEGRKVKRCIHNR